MFFSVSDPLNSNIYQKS